MAAAPLTEMPRTMSLDISKLTGADGQVFEWLRDRFGGAPRNFCRQLRWRIGWEAEVPLNGGWQPVIIRGDRGGSFAGPMTMRQEAAVHDIMERHGVRAPRVYGVIDEPLAIVMEKLPGTINTGFIADADQRWKVRSEWIRTLAKLHAIPVDEFGAIGLKVPGTSREAALSLYTPCIDIVRERLAGRPLPVVEFLARWIEDNAPEDRTRFGFLTGDSGQFLYDETGFTGIIDFEVGYVGDPAAEFAGMRLRNGSEPLGEISKLADYYEELTGEPISQKIIAYHSAGFAGTNGMLCWPLVLDPTPDQDFIAYLQFSIATTRWGLQGVSEAEGIALEPVSEPVPNPGAPWPGAFPQMHRQLAEPPVSENALRYHLDMADALATYLERCDLFGGSILAADLADAAALTGGGPYATRLEADLAVEAYVKAAARDQTERLVQHFHRWLERQNYLLRGCGSQAYLTSLRLQTIPLRAADKVS